MGASSWHYIEPYAGDIVVALATVRQREFERLFVHIFGTVEPTRADFEQARECYDARQPGSEELWEMPQWSAWCRPLKDANGATTAIAFWGRSGD
ncbi:hypothetical protein ACWCP6_19795 [Streptomyces sp. NPDC002004]